MLKSNSLDLVYLPWEVLVFDAIQNVNNRLSYNCKALQIGWHF